MSTVRKAPAERQELFRSKGDFAQHRLPRLARQTVLSKITFGTPCE
jgi:hypothetical protein